MFCDTWFSSALWPFSTLGWPDKTKELDYFYPTTTACHRLRYHLLLGCAHDLLRCGADGRDARSRRCCIHGLVRDAQGRKMSKSLGNGIDPLEVIDQYGADALRFTLATGNSPGQRYAFLGRAAYRRPATSANKIWNASRFIQMNLTIDKDKAVQLPADLALEDKWIVSKFNTLVADVTRQHRPVRARSCRLTS